MSTSSDELAFLKAIADNPADETARLAYADWLQDHGDGARAAVARLSAEFARFLRELGEPHRKLRPEWVRAMNPLFDRLTAVRVPNFGPEPEVIVIRLSAAVGDVVRADQTLGEFDTDKATGELYAPADGCVLAVFKVPGDRAKVGEAVLLLLRLTA